MYQEDLIDFLLAFQRERGASRIDSIRHCVQYPWHRILVIIWSPWSPLGQHLSQRWRNQTIMISLHW